MLPLIMYIPFVYKLFFIKGDTNIIFWGLLFQWLNVAIQAIYCTVLGIPLNELFIKTIFPANLMEYTDYLSVTGLYFYGLGIFLAIRSIKVGGDNAIWEKYSPRKILQTYVIVSIFINLNQVAIWNFPTLVQYFFFFFYIKWGFFLITFISIFKRAPELKLLLYVVIAIEFVVGLSSYFASSFTNILLFSLVAFASVSKKISMQKAIIFCIVGVLMFHMAVLWTAAKGNYRTYLNQGKGVQKVEVSRDAARAKLLELIVKVDPETYQKSVEEVINRIGYIQYFAAAVRFVPARVPFEDGKIYTAAISHYLVPRFIDPNKPELDDSKHTNKYTGLGVSDRNRSTSFSLGSFADAYIDFGPTFMFAPIFLFGMLVGLFYRYLYRPTIWGLIFTGPFFLLINVYGADTTKALGFILIYFLVMAFLNKRIVKIVDPMMRADKSK
jgi:hypothetical protein